MSSPAWMGSTREAVSDPRVRAQRRLFLERGKVRKTPVKSSSASSRKRLDEEEEPWLGENLKDLGELEYQRSAPQPLLNFVWEKTLKTYLRLKHIEKRIREDADVLLHGAPQNPFLWPDLIEPVRPGGKHPHVVVQAEVQRACRPGESIIRSMACSSSRAPPCPGHAVPVERRGVDSRPGAIATVIRSWRSH